MEKTPLRGIFVDLGETLIHPSPRVEKQYHKVARSLLPAARLPAPGTIRKRFDVAFRARYREDGAGCFGTTYSGGFWFWQEVIGAIFPRCSGAEIERLTARLFYHFLRPSAWRIFPGAKQCLRACRQAGLSLCLVSNWDRRAPLLLRNLQLANFFDFRFISSEVGLHKPDPRIFEQALAQTGLSAGEVLVLGNEVEVDLKPAKNLGMQTLWFRYPERDSVSWSNSVDSWAAARRFIFQHFPA